jgi:single-strand DNA-binding protein
MNDLNSVTLVGRLTRDPELRATSGGTSVCSLRLAVNDSVKDQSSGEWKDRAGFFDVDVFGARGETCVKYLVRGSQVAVLGKLRWREWEKDGQKRQAVSVVGDHVQFTSRREETPASVNEGSDGADDDIPF